MRLGGDEFAVVTGPLEPARTIDRAARRLIDALARPFELEPGRTYVGVSIGVALAPDSGHEETDLLTAAAIAPCRAKAEGGGRYRVFDRAMGEAVRARQALRMDLHDAPGNAEFRLAHQPLVDLASERLVGFGALPRWSHPRHGPVSPSEFIPLAEETGLIEPIGESVLRQACLTAAVLPEPLRVAVNLSPVQFQRPGRRATGPLASLEPWVRGRAQHSIGLSPALLRRRPGLDSLPCAHGGAATSTRCRAALASPPVSPRPRRAATEASQGAGALGRHHVNLTAVPEALHRRQGPRRTGSSAGGASSRLAVAEGIPVIHRP